MRKGLIFELQPCELNSEGQGSLNRTGRWVRRGNTIVVLPDTEPLPDGREVYELSGGRISSATSRVLTYSTKDVIDKRISIPAQHSLVRLSKNPATSADAVGMLEEVKAGRLAGIYCVNWEKPAQRALRFQKSWWTVIPQGENAVLMLNPDNLSGGQPMIAFRRELDPDCGLLKGEKRFDPSPSRLDAALRKAWSSYRLWNTSGGPGQPAKCTISLGNRTSSELEFPGRGAARPLSNVIPPLLCDLDRQPAPPASPVQVPHQHIARNCNSSSTWRSEAASTKMIPANMNPGFILPSDQIRFDKKLDDALIELMVTKYPSLLAPQSVKERRATQKDKIRVALVDLTGDKICRPGYAGWGSTMLMGGASTAKIIVFYAAHQLLFDLRELARGNSIRKTADLIQKTNEVWTGLICKPDLKWLFAFDESKNPIGIEKSSLLQRHLFNIVNDIDGTLMASELFLSLGFEYMASVLLQSGLRHPAREGLWAGGTFCTGRRTARPDRRCHAVSTAGCPKGEDRVIWTKDPLQVQRIVLTALSVATFFTLLAQGRLVTEPLSMEIEGMLKNACSFIGQALPTGMIRASKCGLAGQLMHDGALIANGQRRYVMVFLTLNANLSKTLRGQLISDLDRLIESNNRP
jgi:hypothetical protein